MKTPTHLEQLKFTDKDSHSIKAKMLKKVYEDALLHGREPRLVIDFPKHGIRLVGEIERL